MLKKIIILSLSIFSLSFVLILFSVNQEPKKSEIFRITEGWTNEVTNVLALENMYDDWYAFVIGDGNLYLGRLEKNIFGRWNFKDFHGNTGFLGSASLENITGSNVFLGASGYSNIQTHHNKSFYFGMITNPKVTKVTLKTENNHYEVTNFVKRDNDIRLFLIISDDYNIPFSLKALDDTDNIVEIITN